MQPNSNKPLSQNTYFAMKTIRSYNRLRVGAFEICKKIFVIYIKIHKCRKEETWMCKVRVTPIELSLFSQRKIENETARRIPIPAMQYTSQSPQKSLFEANCGRTFEIQNYSGGSFNYEVFP